MKIILMSIGTRGDMEPFLAIGDILKEKGEEVVCAFPEQFRDLAEEANMAFASLGSKFVEMLESEDGKAALGGGGSGWKRFLAGIRLARHQTEVNKELVDRQRRLVERENPDRIVYNGKAVYPILWGLDHPGKNILISPLPYMHYVKGHTHVAFNSDFGAVLNKLTYALANFGMVTTLMITKKWLNLGRAVTRRRIRKALRSNRAIYTISPTLFSRPEEWGENLQVLGYHTRKRFAGWSPDQELLDFLDRHDRVLLITFGSMTNPAPEEKTRIIIDTLERNRIPAVINTASGGLVEPKNYDSGLVHFVSRIPYDRIFSRVHGVIHHGGSGTTHLALKHGCATLIIPHIIDQFVWNKIISHMGVGPGGIRIDKLNRKNFEPKIRDLMNNASYKRNAERVAERMRAEGFRNEIYDAVTKKWGQ